jgi:hypothetical protein
VSWELFCITLRNAHTIGKKLVSQRNGRKEINWQKFTNCLKLYLAFEHWVMESHPRSQIRKSITLLGDLITMKKECFPRDEGWGWNLPNMHAFAKMPHSMLKFGFAGNFSGHIGE